MREVAASFGFQWVQREAGAFEVDSLYGQSETDELDQFLSSMSVASVSVLNGATILDAGCGSGRLCAALGKATKATVVGLDVSESVEGAARLSEGLANVLIVHADLFAPPLRPQSIDLVWSEGVIHHTPDAKAVFLQLARLVRPGGKLFVWLYPRSFHPYRLIRDLMPFAWRLPHVVQLALCRILALPLIPALQLHDRLTGRRLRRYREVVFGLHDNLSPRYQSRHSVSELLSWFAEAGFSNVRSVGPPTGVVGERSVVS